MESKKIIVAILACCLAVIVTGCESGDKQSPQEIEIARLEQEKTQLAHKLEQSEKGAEQLKEQLGELSALPADVRKKVYQLQSVTITRYTNIYDKDNDGVREKLIVYFQPRDEQGDAVKAAGAVDVGLWDLNKEPGKAMLRQWHVGPEQLKELWFSTITTNYRLTFDLDEEIIEGNDPLTVKLKFTDYLTGKVFDEQKVINR